MTSSMFQRRDVLRFSLVGGACAATPAWVGCALADESPPSASASTAEAGPKSAEQPPPVAGPNTILAPPVDFAAGGVTDMARKLATSPFKPISSDLPAPFASLSPEQYAAIHLKPEARIWADTNVGFVIEPLHRGFQFNNPIAIYLVSDGKAYKLVYDTKMFEFGKLTPSAKVGDIGFSGFRALVTRSGKDAAEVASFQGANFFHAVAPGQIEGVMARALAMRIGDPKGEEIPLFRSFWIEKPSLVNNLLVVHAVIDSESVTGAFRFTIRPGDATIIDTEGTLFPRKDVENYGLATMSATHLLGYIDHKKFDDYRPNVDEVGGLQILTGAGEWIWRPVSNRESLQISTFVDDKPRGFGFVIRDRDFEDYDDEELHWERRPTLWIEPIGDWAKGGVQLIEIPSQSDANDNILTFWRPQQPLKANVEASFAYRQFWCWDPPIRPNVARTLHSRSGSAGKRSRFLVEFKGDPLGDATLTKGLSPTLTAGSGSITIMKTYADPERKAFRVFFELDPAGAPSSELRLVLMAQGRKISETWLYRWTSS